ncbi:hypothetical protein DFH06DRAFT_1129461 [Mycena polygramma]|nr:hypothetical protein DFH06DRAFT_1129461 [Mycena polygramma]
MPPEIDPESTVPGEWGVPLEGKSAPRGLNVPTRGRKPEKPVPRREVTNARGSLDTADDFSSFLAGFVIVAAASSSTKLAGYQSSYSSFLVPQVLQPSALPSNLACISKNHAFLASIPLLFMPPEIDPESTVPGEWGVPLEGKSAPRGLNVPTRGRKPEKPVPRREVTNARGSLDTADDFSSFLAGFVIVAAASSSTKLAGYQSSIIVSTGILVREQTWKKSA